MWLQSKRCAGWGVREGGVAGVVAGMHGWELRVAGGNGDGGRGVLAVQHVRGRELRDGGVRGGDGDVAGERHALRALLGALGARRGVGAAGRAAVGCAWLLAVGALHVVRGTGDGDGGGDGWRTQCVSAERMRGAACVCV